jgi:hypothetical protein
MTEVDLEIQAHFWQGPGSMPQRVQYLFAGSLNVFHSSQAQVAWDHKKGKGYATWAHMTTASWLPLKHLLRLWRTGFMANAVKWMLKHCYHGGNGNDYMFICECNTGLVYSRFCAKSDVKLVLFGHSEPLAES